KESDTQSIAMREKLQELLALLSQSTRERKPSEIVAALIAELEQEHAFPEANYVLAGRLLTPTIARMIENVGKHWVGELRGGCPIQWEGPWLHLDRVAEKLRRESPESFRAVVIRMVDGTSKTVHLFSRSVRLDHYGRKRIVILHQAADLTDTPVFLFTD